MSRDTPGPAAHRSRPACAGVGYMEAVAAAASWLAFPFVERSSLVMTSLLGTVVIAVRHGRGPTVAASTPSVAVFDFLLVLMRAVFALSQIPPAPVPADA